MMGAVGSTQLTAQDSILREVKDYSAYVADGSRISNPSLCGYSTDRCFRNPHNLVFSSSCSLHGHATHSRAPMPASVLTLVGVVWMPYSSRSGVVVHLRVHKKYCAMTDGMFFPSVAISVT